MGGPADPSLQQMVSFARKITTDAAIAALRAAVYDQSWSRCPALSAHACVVNFRPAAGANPAELALPGSASWQGFSSTDV
ncbi:hypothetical protein HPP92_004442 [Vanilla planifolia]|uniref:Uncharacterized protein n=1 Tax=Vanilla planifolia TaxID=51239 RepID=A0A835VDM4_VANPL|nr:hypothetical protein HPP92_004442 [Vanilla planifolia]